MKIKISDKRKKIIKENFTSFVIKKDKLKKNERDYLNKIIAGKKRQETGIKNKEGKYINAAENNELNRLVLAKKGIEVKTFNKLQLDKEMKLAGITNKEKKEFYNEFKSVFDNMIKNGSTHETSKNSKQLERDIDNFKGQIIIDNGIEKKEVNKSMAQFLLASFKQYIATRANAVDIVFNPELTFGTSQMIIQIPDNKLFINSLKNFFGFSIIEELKEVDPVEITEAIEFILEDIYKEKVFLKIYSSDKEKRKEKEKKERASLQKKYKCFNCDTQLNFQEKNVRYKNGQRTVICTFCKSENIIN